MPLIHTVTPEHATGKLKEVYDQVTAAFGHVPNALQIYSSSPEQVARHWQDIGYYMQHPSLSFTLLAMMRMLVSQNTHCDYCVGFNEAMLINVAKLAPEQVAAAKKNPADAPLSDKDKAMLLFTLKATRDSTSIEAADLAGLRAQGWSDGDIVDGLNHAASMLAGDTIFNAFKVERDY